ncbi:copper amine oxidase N-terminal domain-containing protein [Paenibacillus zeisoli]|uniref:Copper amine oxidase N-terminal domain-containing protein n=1 Tax=Paenibacillus zeisoli TaxID=2496267 RepID=A0A3S1D2L5_9BACL|nr:copper amine oxidase N-terminal domain-containing protein [Paenibacillus zeisoli]RUT35544.1 copper amine oxidase N-terminal domain-containing protein [Paenibacillus zeisoli]
MIKVKFLSMLMVLIFSVFFSSIAYGSGKISISVNGQLQEVNKVNPNDSSLVIKDSVFVPLRSLSALNLILDWNPQTKEIKVNDGSNALVLAIDKNIAYKNNTKLELSNPPLLKNGRTWVPLRFISQAFNAKVRWFEEKKHVEILTEEFINIQAKSLNDLIKSGESREKVDQLVGERFYDWRKLLTLHNTIKEPAENYYIYNLFFDSSDSTKLAVRIINRGLSGDVETYSDKWKGTGPLYDLIVHLEIKDNKFNIVWIGELTDSKNKIKTAFNIDNGVDLQLQKILGQNWGYQQTSGKPLIFSKMLRSYKSSSIGGFPPIDYLE